MRSIQSGVRPRNDCLRLFLTEPHSDGFAVCLSP